MATVFVYGTLQFPEVLHALIGRVPRSAQGTIRGHQRYAIRGQVFPGTIPVAHDSQVSMHLQFPVPTLLYVFSSYCQVSLDTVYPSNNPRARLHCHFLLELQHLRAHHAAAVCPQVEGLVLFELTPEEMFTFDEFEGEEYYKAQVQPQLADGSSVEAEVYLWQEKLRPLLYGEWSEDDFREQHLARYTTMCAEFAESLK